MHFFQSRYFREKNQNFNGQNFSTNCTFNSAEMDTLVKTVNQ